MRTLTQRAEARKDCSKIGLDSFVCCCVLYGKYALLFVCFFNGCILILKTAFFFFLLSESNKLKAKETAKNESLRQGVGLGSDTFYCKVEQIKLKHSIVTLPYWGIGYKSI